MTMKKKALAVVICVAMMAVGALATYAYFTDQDSATNTFTAGKVKILLDEKDVDKDEDKTDITEGSNPARDTKNSYHLLPGHEYDKDPTVTVLADSEKAYVRMLVTINNQRQLDEVFAKVGGVELTTFLKEYDKEKWPLHAVTKDEENNTRTYEFRYYEIVDKKNTNNSLKPLFTKVSIPGKITAGGKTLNLGNEEMAAFEGLQIDVVAHAIQSDGFDTADDAWKEFK